MDDTTLGANPPDPAYIAHAPVRATKRRAALAAAGAAGLLVVGVAGFTLAASPAPSAPTDSSTGASAGASAGSPDASAGPSGGPNAHRTVPFGRFGRGLGRFGGPGVPFAAIKVTAVDGSNVSLATEDGWKRTITVGDGTTVTRAGQTIGVGDLKVGDEVRIGEQRETDGSYTVTRVDVVLPTVAGEVTAKDATSITIKRFDGTTETIHVGSSTTYVTRGNGAASLSDVAVGSAVVAQGTARSDGSLDAERVLVGQPGGIENGIGRGWRFGPGMGGPGRPKAGDPNAPSPSGTPDPSASTSGA